MFEVGLYVFDSLRRLRRRHHCKSSPALIVSGLGAKVQNAIGLCPVDCSDLLLVWVQTHVLTDTLLVVSLLLISVQNDLLLVITGYGIA